MFGGSGSLPVNPSLASALAQHGLSHDSETGANGRSIVRRPSSAGGGGGTRRRTSVQALAAHPSLPRVAYLVEETTASGSPSPNNASAASSKKTKGGGPPVSRTTVKYQHLVVRQYGRDGGFKNAPDNLLPSLRDGNKVLAALPMEKLPPRINRFRQSKSKSSRLTNQPLTLASLGPLQSISFLDREALFWQTRRRLGSPSNLDAASLGAAADGGEVVLRAESDWNDVDGGMGQGTCLGLQFSRALVILRFEDRFERSDDDPSPSSAFEVLCCLEGQRAVGGGKDGGRMQYAPTSAAVPLTESVVVYGCSDGAMRFHNLVPSMLYSTRTETNLSSGSVASGPLGSPSSSSGSGKSTNRMRQATIKSVRGPNGRHDPVVTILNVDPAYGEGHRAGGEPSVASGVPSQVGSGVATASDDVTLVVRSRLLTACSSGVAFLWDVRATIDRASGALRDLNVLPPLVRLDGLGSLTVSPRKSSGTLPQAPPGGFWGKARAAAAKSKEGGNSSSSAPAPYSRVVPSMSYDPHRHLFTWALPADAPAAAVGHRADYELESLSPNSPQARKEQEDRLFFDKWVTENGGFVKVWDFSLVDALISSMGPPSSSPRPPPKMPPAAVMKLPTLAASAASPQSVIAGLPYAPITAASLACACLSNDGSKLLVLAAPLPGAVDTIDNGTAGAAQSSSSESPVKNQRKKPGGGRVAKPKVMYVNCTPCHSVSLAGGAMSPFARGSAVAASQLSPDFVAVATDHGVAVAHLADGESWSSKLDSLDDDQRSGDFVGTTGTSNKDDSSTLICPSNIPAGPIHTIISIGGVGNRPGILFVENHTVYSSRLGIIRTSNDQKQSLVEKVDLPDPVVLCKLKLRRSRVPWKTIGSTRMANFVQSLQPMNPPPQLISSPSGRYLCLYWRCEKKIEILHAGSLLARETNPGAGTANASDGLGQRVTPYIESGSNILSFAWVGDDDNFAILRQRADPSQTESKGLNSASSPDKGKRDQPQVELFKLAEVKVDAVELAAGASVAAATTVRLGTLTVRGGDRFVPNALFGGPALCVGCLSPSGQSNNVGVDEGIAYFYSRKTDAIEKHDERAVAYTTIGTSIPYPDLVAWDEYGQLCAISYGSRVAAYLSEESNFILLGSVRVAGSNSSEELPLISLKFIHGVLYCSTQSSVHVIFLGNLEDDNAVCELDSYTIATAGVPLHGTNNPDLSSPVPVVAALMRPHILAYHLGGLLVSTLCGLRLLPLSHPIIRIGTLLAANLIDRARKWILAIPTSEHDNLAHFLIRRGHVDLAINDLNGLSLESYIDLCMRYERTDELERLIDAHGSEVVHNISDWGRRGEADGGYSAYFAIGMYMLGKDRIGCAKELVTRATESGVSELLVDAMKLATFISIADQPGGNALMQDLTNAMDFNSNGQLALVNIVN